MTTEVTTVEPVTGRNLLEVIDFESIIADFRRFLRFFLVIFAIVFLAVLIPVMNQTPLYDATSQVMLDPRVMRASPAQDVLSGLPDDTTTVDTEVEILGSQSLVSRLVDSLHLDQDPEFNPALKGRRILGIPLPGKSDKAVSPQIARQLVIDTVRAGATIKRLGMTRIITISYRSESADKSAKIANEWARLYLSQQLETKFQATKEANDWLNGRISDLRTQVETAETELQNYKVANGLMSANGDNTLAQQEISVLEQQLATVRVDQAESDARLNVARKQLAGGSNGEDLGEALNSDVVKGLRAQRAALSQRIADMSTRYGPLHPEIIKAQGQLKDIDGQINAEVNRIISNLEAQAQIQRQRTASLQGSVGRARGQLAGNNRASVRLNELQRNADAVSTLYQSYLDRFKETSSQSGLDTTDARIVSNAAVPLWPSTPKLPLGIALGFVAGLGVATLAVFVRRALFSGLTTGVDVETVLAQPYLGSLIDLPTLLPRGEKAEPLKYVVDKPLSAFAEGFRSLRAGLVYARGGQQPKVIAITSSLPGEGKTTTSLCLAKAMALAGQSVLVIDCDLRRRSVDRVLGLDAKKGLLDVLSGEARLDEVLVHDSLPGVDYLPLANGVTPPKDVFGSMAMDMLLDHVRTKYDIVILDTAPVIPVVDTRILLRKADVAVLLVKWRQTPRQAVRSAIDLLGDVGATVGGVVLTKVDIKAQSKFGYGDSMYYFNQYKEYYAK